MKNNMMHHFKIGDFVYGYCNGYFGRDDYDSKICVYVTPFCAVFEYIDREKGAIVLNISTLENDHGVIETDTDKWKNPEEY